MRLPAGALSIVLLLAGCAHAVDGIAEPAASALKILPTEDEVTSAVGNTLSTFGFQPFVGGPEILPDGFRTDAEASPITCIGVADTTMRVVYEATPMVEAARESFFTLVPRVAVTGADAAVIRMASVEDARRIFDDSVRQWSDCDGKTVEKRLRGTTNAEVFADIGDVSTSGSILSATLRTQRGRAGPTSFYQRALGVRDDTIVEVSLAVTRNDEPIARAEAVAQAMLDKV